MTRFICAFLLHFVSNLTTPSAVAQEPESTTAAVNQQRRMIDFVDSTTGNRIRQMFNPAGDEHNLYHYRRVFNADNSRLLGIETPKGTTDYRVTLYNGEGHLLRSLFTQAQYDWTLAWDRFDPRIFYTHRQGTIFRYDVETGRAERLRTFESPSVAGPTGLSLNQAGDRLLLRMTDQTVRNYRLPALDDERICKISIPDGWYANWDKLRFTGHNDDFALTFALTQPPLPEVSRVRRTRDTRQEIHLGVFTRIYDGKTGQLIHQFDQVTVGHHDFSPDGKLAYVEGHFNQGPEMRLHLVNIDGTDDRVVFTALREQLLFVRNYHITWPSEVRDWFLLSFFPQSGRFPPKYKPYLDELIQVDIDGQSRVLARTGTACGANFWAQPQQSLSADGTHVLFHTNGTCTVGQIGYESSGTIDQCILYLK